MLHMHRTGGVTVHQPGRGFSSLVTIISQPSATQVDLVTGLALLGWLHTRRHQPPALVCGNVSLMDIYMKPGPYTHWPLFAASGPAH